MKNRSIIQLALSIMALAFMLTACATANLETGSESTESADTISPASTETEWTITVTGMQEKTINSSELADSMSHESHRMEMTLKSKDETHSYVGLPFRYIAAIADMSVGDHPGYKFDEDLWKAGYDITFTAADGYSATFNTADVSWDDLMLTATRDGETVSPRIVGEINSKLWVKDLVSIDLDLAGSAIVGDEFQLKLIVNGKTDSFTLDELEASPWYAEGRGSFTTSAGTTYTNDYGGIRLADFLRSFMRLEKDSMVTFVATDGYEMSYSGEQILDESDGIWILAFKMDGEDMPLDPGYIRTVKIGPEVPNITGHTSVKMIEEIRIDGESYKDFTLLMKGQKDFEVDRQTMQSGVSCHNRTVTYYDRKNDLDIIYTGIPLWRLLAYSDDQDYAPHMQDSSIISYNRDAAIEGYEVVISAADGFAITLDSSQLDKNDDVIIAMYRDGEELPESDFPLVIVWDKDAETVPEGIKAVRNIASIELLF